jgi:hypothetical protein
VVVARVRGSERCRDREIVLVTGTTAVDVGRIRDVFVIRQRTCSCS